MAGNGGPSPKKTRLATIFEKFTTFSDKESFCEEYKNLIYNRRVSLISDMITYCDAAAEYGKPFSRATCHAKHMLEELYPFGSIFSRGVEILNDLTGRDEYIPVDDETKALLIPLLNYLLDEKSHDCLRRLAEEKSNETQLMITLAVHFFSKLSVSKGFKMDKYASRNGSICTCGNCKEEEIMKFFDDTSIGNKNVWHGSLDILLESSDIGIHLTPKDETSLGGRSSVEVKYSKLGSMTVRDQVLAQAITFSFMQQQRHPAMKHFLIPSILASNKAVQFFFYDSKNDILLESREFEYLVGDPLVLNYQTVIAAWLVLNYKHLCSGPTKYILEGPKADFHKFAGPALDIYRSELKFGNIGEAAIEGRMSSLTWRAIDVGKYNRSRFRWPEALPPIPSDTDKESV